MCYKIDAAKVLLKSQLHIVLLIKKFLFLIFFRFLPFTKLFDPKQIIRLPLVVLIFKCASGILTKKSRLIETGFNEYLNAKVSGFAILLFVGAKLHKIFHIRK